MVKSGTSKNRGLVLPILIGGGLWLGFCWSLLIGLNVPGFRDSAYLYYPLFEWLDQEWESGEVPLWNPYCNFGMSNVGDNTTSLLYPGKAIFVLRFLNYPARYGIFIAIHILLAGLGAFYLAKQFRVRTPGATLAAISFAGSGAVLTQATNVIYLVSAAWLPFALAAIWKMSRTSDYRWGIAAGVCCAMMILGGDPQMVYHVGLIAAASTVAQLLRDRHRILRTRETQIGLPENRRISLAGQVGLKRGFCLIAMVLTTTLLALVQILPTYHWSKLSERSSAKHPLNIYQAFSPSFASEKESTSSDSADENRQENPAGLASWTSLIEPPQPNSQASNVYGFSLPPWTIAEIFFPNGSGKLMPLHQRWAEGIAGPQGSPDRIWYPSIYFGWLTAWLAIGGISLVGRNAKSWLSRIMLFFLLGSFGWYGLSWLLPIPECGSQVGGVYWWMVTFLPGYSSFRYPAKLFVIASLCLCVLAGMRLNDGRKGQFNPFQSLIGWGILCMIGGCAFAILMGQFDAFFQRLPDDSLFGPFDITGAKRGLLLTLLHSLLMASVVGLHCRRQQLRTRTSTEQLPQIVPGSSRQIWLLIGIAAFDLIIANYWILSLVPEKTFTTPIARPTIVQTDDHPEIQTTRVPLTLYRKRDAYLPEHWKLEQSPDRLSEIIQWQRETLYPKHHLTSRIRLFGSFSSIQPELYERLFAELEKEPDAVPEFTTSPTRNDLKSPTADLLQTLCDGEVSATTAERSNRIDINVWRSQSKLVFLVREGQTLEHLASSGRTTDTEFETALHRRCEVTQFKSNSIELALTVDEPSYLVHSSIYDGNWEAIINDTQSNKSSTQQLIELKPGYQGFQIEPGQYHVRLSYNPRSFWQAAWVSGIGWVVVCIYLVAIKFRRQ